MMSASCSGVSLSFRDTDSSRYSSQKRSSGAVSLVASTSQMLFHVSDHTPINSPRMATTPLGRHDTGGRRRVRPARPASRDTRFSVSPRRRRGGRSRAAIHLGELERRTSGYRQSLDLPSLLGGYGQRLGAVRLAKRSKLTESGAQALWCGE